MVKQDKTDVRDKATPMVPGTLVKKSNKLVRAKWNPKTSWEPKIIALIASAVKMTDQDFKKYSFHASELLSEEDKKDGKMKIRYDRIRQAMQNIMHTHIEYQDGKNFRIINVFMECGYENGEIFAIFHPKMKPHLLNLKANFTVYYLSDFLKLSSIYSQRIFEILKSWDNQKKIVLPLDGVEGLIKMLSVPKSLVRYSDFKRNVLDVAYQEINAKTSLKFSWKPVKKGRSVEEIEFKIDQNIHTVEESEAQDTELFGQGGTFALPGPLPATPK